MSWRFSTQRNVRSETLRDRSEFPGLYDSSTKQPNIKGIPDTQCINAMQWSRVLRTITTWPDNRKLIPLRLLSGLNLQGHLPQELGRWFFLGVSRILDIWMSDHSMHARNIGRDALLPPNTSISLILLVPALSPYLLTGTGGWGLQNHRLIYNFWRVKCCSLP